MRLRQLEAFRQVMLTGSVTRAAQALGISQPGASRLLAELERALGFRLFERRAGRVHPTPEAASFYRHVEKSFVGLASLERAAADIASAKGATLRIAAFPAISLELVPAALAEFNRRHPATHVSLAVTNSPRVADLVSTLQAEVGLSTLPAGAGGIEIERRFTLRCVCALPPGHRLAAQRTVGARDLRRETLISLDPGFATTRGTREALRRGNVEPRVAAETSFSFSACEMVRRGLGVAVVDPLTALALAGRGIAFRRFAPGVDFTFGVIRAAYQAHSLAGHGLLAILQPMLDGLERAVAAMLESGAR